MELKLESLKERRLKLEALKQGSINYTIADSNIHHTCVERTRLISDLPHPSLRRVRSSLSTTLTVKSYYYFMCLLFSFITISTFLLLT